MAKKYSYGYEDKYKDKNVELEPVEPVVFDETVKDDVVDKPELVDTVVADEPVEVVEEKPVDKKSDKKLFKNPFKKSEATEPDVKPEKAKGCEACDNTGLDRKTGLSDAQVCPVCDGSPFEKKKNK